MRPSLLYMWATVVALLSMPACAAQPRPVAIEVSCDDFAQAWSPTTASASISKDLAVAVGTSFTVTLCANPSTGFQWETAKIADASVVQQTDRRFETPPTNLPGAAGKETWTFKALKPGTSTVSLDYSRPWTGGEKATWRFGLKVTAT